MITKKIANLAREQYSKSLINKGVHSIAVDEIIKNGKKEFVVLVFVDKKHNPLPDTLEVIDDGKIYKVPLIVEIEERFRFQ